MRSAEGHPARTPGLRGLKGGRLGMAPDRHLQRVAGAVDVRRRLSKSREAARLLLLELRRGPPQAPSDQSDGMPGGDSMGPAEPPGDIFKTTMSRGGPTDQNTVAKPALNLRNHAGFYVSACMIRNTIMWEPNTSLNASLNRTGMRLDRIEERL